MADKLNWASLIDQRTDDGTIVSSGDSAVLGLGTPSSEKPASKTAMFNASFPKDLANKVAVYASHRFPDIPVKTAMEKYGIKDDRIFFVADDGNPYWENPPASLDRIALDESIVANAGAAVPMLSSVVGELAGAAVPLPGTGMAGAVIGGSTGEGLRQLAAQKTMPPSMQPPPFDLMDIGIEGAAGGIGSGIGRGIVAMTNRGRRVNDARELQEPSTALEFGTTDVPVSRTVQQQADYLAEGGARSGIPVTAAEQTGLRSVVNAQKALMVYPGANDILDQFYKIRNMKVRTALDGWFASVSPVGGAALTARQRGVDAAGAAIERERQILQRQAKPFYQEAELVYDVDVKPVISMLGAKIQKAKGGVKAKLESIRKDLNVDVTFEGVTTTVPDRSIRGLDSAKKRIDAAIKKATKKGDNDAVKELNDVRVVLLAKMDEAAPTYGQARGVYEEGMPKVTELTKSLVGDIAKTNSPMSAPQMLFSSKLSDAATVKQAREAFKEAGRSDAWNGMLESWLRETAENIPTTASSGLPVNIGSAMRSKIASTPRQQKILMEALKDIPNGVKNAVWLMDVLDATSRAMATESNTAMLTAAGKDLANAGSGWLGGGIELFQVWEAPRKIGSILKAISQNKYTENLARMLTTDANTEAMNALRKMSPRSATTVAALATVLAHGVENFVSDGLLSMDEPDRMPRMLPPAGMGVAPPIQAVNPRTQ